MLFTRVYLLSLHLPAPPIYELSPLVRVDPPPRALGKRSAVFRLQSAERGRMVIPWLEI